MRSESRSRTAASTTASDLQRREGRSRHDYDNEMAADIASWSSWPSGLARGGRRRRRDRPEVLPRRPDRDGSSTRRTPRRCRSARSIWPTTRSRTRSPGRATRPRTSERRTSTRWTRCRTRTGSPIGSVPGRSAWTSCERARHRATGRPPGPGRSIAAKNDGVMPGFTVRDTAGQVWFIKFNPPGYPAMATGTEVVVTKLFWALGYHVPEVHIASLRPDQLAIDETATHHAAQRQRAVGSSGRTSRALLGKAHREEDGTYRVIASKALEGKPVGGFRFYGTRSDDPNDVVPHEHRRELRAYGTFAAWVNHVDSKSINTLDTRDRAGGQEGSPPQPAGLRLDRGERRRLSAGTVRGLGISRRGQEDPGGDPHVRLLHQGLAHDPALSRALSWRISYRSLGVGPGEVEAALRQLRLPVGPDRRQVLGRAPAQVFHRPDADGGHARGPVQRSAVGGHAREVPDRSP